MEKYYLNEDDYGVGIPSITTYVDDSSNFPSVVDRYFTRYYKKTSLNGDNEDHLILFHTNGICLIMLAKSHIAFKKGIASINYDFGNFNRSSQNQVKGKHKKGAMNLQKDTAIAIIKTNDGCEYKVYSCVVGKLLEVNENLKHDLSKLELEGHGYIAVVLPKISNIEKEKESLIHEKDYVQ